MSETKKAAGPHNKKHYIIIDTESTIDDTVADFGAVIVDKAGNVLNEMGVLLKGHFDEKELFYNKTEAKGLWSIDGMAKRKAKYTQMLNDGRRMLASVEAVNRWLLKAVATYPNLALTAYNLAFDSRICDNTGIILDDFKDRFCLWQAAIGNFTDSKAYREFCLQNHLFNNRTDKGNMCVQTNAEVMASFIAGEMLPEEPHTALEDAKHYEAPILKKLLTKKNWRDKIKSHNWQSFVVRDWYTVK